MKNRINTETGIGNKLKFYRRANGMSQEGLAETSGVSIRTIQRVEKGMSIGSAYTLYSLAKALNIHTTDLIVEKPLELLVNDDNMNQLKLMNLSSISVLLIPLANIIVPALIFWKNKNDKAIHTHGSKILSFQILWTLCTLLMMLIIPLILVFLFEPLQGSKIPLFVPVYFISVILNVYLTIRFAIGINNQSDFLKKLTNIL